MPLPAVRNVIPTVRSDFRYSEIVSFSQKYLQFSCYHWQKQRFIIKKLKETLILFPLHHLILLDCFIDAEMLLIVQLFICEGFILELTRPLIKCNSHDIMIMLRYMLDDHGAECYHDYLKVIPDID